MSQKSKNQLPENSYKKALRRTRQKPKSDLGLVKDLQTLGYARIVGVDEVGRGAIAGPLVVCAVEINKYIEGVTDSKLLSKSIRSLLATKIHHNASQIRYGVVHAHEIDKLGISKSLELAYKRALAYANTDVILTDFVKLTSIKHISFVKGDLLNFSIACASIMAKVYRDNLMRIYGISEPNYQWHQNVGYGTNAHFQAIKTYGKSKLHRNSFLIDF
ncbi:ribonuclease HII [Candidatus Berkelbacteria bacterium]|nr:ribonuclease HII [Candidatus Berkelbacteria bacterium]